VADYQSQTI